MSNVDPLLRVGIDEALASPSPSLLEYAQVKDDQLARFWPEIEQARSRKPSVPWTVIVRYLKDVHGIETTDTTLRRKFANRGARG